jgi:hypothetical protein
MKIATKNSGLLYGYGYHQLCNVIRFKMQCVAEKPSVNRLHKLRIVHRTGFCQNL